MGQSFSDWLMKKENYGGMTGAPSFATPGPDGFGTSVPTTAMQDFSASDKPPTAKDRIIKRKKCNCKNKK